jgi:hypothetical protein
MTTADQPTHYRVRMTRRMRIEGTWRAPGEIVRCPVGYLRVAHWWVKVGAGVPADERTRVALELYSACKALGEAA